MHFLSLGFRRVGVRRGPRPLGGSQVMLDHILDVLVVDLNHAVHDVEAPLVHDVVVVVVQVEQAGVNEGRPVAPAPPALLTLSRVAVQHGLGGCLGLGARFHDNGSSVLCPSPTSDISAKTPAESLIGECSSLEAQLSTGKVATHVDLFAFLVSATLR